MPCRFRLHVIALVLVLGAISGCGGGGGGGGSPPVPAISTMSPVGTSAGNAAFTLTVLGSGFTSASTVQWNGASRTTFFFSGSTLKAQIPASDIVAVGTATVSVSDPAGGVSNSRTFTAAATTITFQSTGKLDGTDVPNLNNVQNIWVMDAGGTNRKPLTDLTTNVLINSSEPAWSPDGSQIAYASNRALDGSDAPDRQNNNIWVSTRDGVTQAPLTRLTDGGAVSFDPHFSPDGTQIAYVSQRKLDGSDLSISTTNIWLMNADGTNPRHLTAVTALGAGTARPISWSPDSTRLVFASDQKLDGSDNPNNARNIWIVRADGSGLKPLTNGTASPALQHGFPAWSPDGTKIAYLSDRALDGSDALNTPNIAQNIWVMNPDGTSPTPLTSLTAVNVGIQAFAWSPDGTKFAFISARPLDGSNTDVPNGTAQNVWVMNANGLTPPTHVTAFMAASIAVSDLAWSAGGTKLLFSSNAAVGGGDALNNTNSTADTNIFVMDADGGNRTPLTKYTTTFSSASAPAQP